MSILSRVKISPQQRYDLEDFLAEQSAARTDAKLWTQATMSTSNYVLGGFTLSGIGLTQATVAMTGAAFIFPQNTADFSYFVSSPTEPDVVIPDSSLVDGARNYVEALLTTQDGTPLTKAFWDPEANSGSGQEFNQIVNTITDLKCSFVVSTGGFTGSPDRLPIAIIDCDNSGVIKIILDRRKLYGRLADPSNIDNSYSWGTKVEPVYNLSMTGVTGTFVAGETITIGGETAVVTTGGTSSIAFNVPTGINFGNGSSVVGGTSGATGTVNTILESFSGVDKSLKGQKNINDALMTEMKAIKGVRFWWMDAPSLGGMKSEISSVIAPMTSTAQIVWDGSKLKITDGNLTPSDSDVVAAIRLLASTKNLLLTRQDDGKEVATISLSDVPDSGSLGLTIGVHSLSIAWNDSTATIQSDWNASGAYAATISGSAASKKIVITANAAGVQASHVTLGANTLKKVAVTVTPTLTVKQGMAADGSISIPDGDFLFINLPNPLADQTYDGVGTSAANYQVATRGALGITDQSYWIAYREGTKLIWRGGMELQAGESSSISDTVPQSLLDAIGLASETSTPAYSSDIRGVSSESIVSRVGVLTDAMGDEQEDRSGYFRSDNQVTWTGSQLQFTSDIILEFLNTKTGTTTRHTILVANSPISLANGDTIYVQIDRTQAAENVTPVNSSVTPIPAQTQGKKDIIVLAKRIDALGAGYLHIPFHKQVLESGQTVRLGASGSGSGTGSGTGDDLDSLKFNASFGIDTFSDLPTSSKAAVDSGNTTALYDTANKVYRMSYDASKTVTGTGTSMHLSAAPSYTVAVGDVLIVNSQAKRITAIGTINSDGGATTPFTIESAFSADPTAAQATVSQVFTTTDLRAHTEASTGLSIAAVISDPVSQYMLRYEDSFASGDAVWDYPGSPLAAFSVSADGSNWTGVNTRPTSITSSNEPIRTVAVSGSNFIARFFSSATSGSGAFNLIKYKAFMHYEAGTIAASYTNTAICRTDGAGSAVNCSVSSATGKTRITTNFSFGSVIKVYLDGKKLPLFVDSVTTPGAYYTKLTANIIELDADYSGLGVQFELEIPSNTVDNTDANAGYIAAIQDNLTAVGVGFVDDSAQLTAVNGTPGVGQFNSSITGRSAISDLANNLKVRMAGERILTQAIYPMQNEVGPNGEIIWGVLGDSSNQIRFGGAWSAGNDSTGTYIVSSQTTDFLEVTFFGTGLNILYKIDGNNRNWTVAVDGGAPVSGTSYPGTSGTGVLNARSYSPNCVLNVVSGLSQGLHTVKMVFGSAQVGTVFGFEIINESSNVNVRPGVAYSKGKKLIQSLAQNLVYNSSFDSMTQAGSSAGALGSRGARVLTYLKSDATIGRAAYLVNAASATLGSADHTYEDVARTYHFREFASTRSDDFSSISTGGTFDAVNTLSDGTTSLSGHNVQTLATTQEGVGCFFSTTNGFLTVTFVGTGLDIGISTDSTTRSFSAIYVDGGSTLGTLSKTGSTGAEVRKIVSGLKYGTHTVKFENSSATTSPVINKIVVYQPKKPSLPAGAVELADYNIMATFDSSSSSTTTSFGHLQIPTGTLVKYSTKEMIYSGTWTANLQVFDYAPNGWQLATSTTNDYVEYTFFGTGVVVHMDTNNAGTYNVNVTIDGSLNAAGVPMNANVTNNGSGNYSTANSGSDTNCRIAFTGLSLGIHKIRVTRAGGTGNFNFNGFEIITPIHSHKNNLISLQNNATIGSQGMLDSRVFSAMKSENAKRGFSQASGVTSGPSTTSTVYVPAPELSTTIETHGRDIRISYSGNITVNPAGDFAYMKIVVDGVTVGTERIYGGGGASPYVTTADSIRIPVSPGVHKVDIYWKVNAGTATLNDITRDLSVEELAAA